MGVIVSYGSRGSPTRSLSLRGFPGNFIAPLSGRCPLPDPEDFRDGGSFEYYIGGYETVDGIHYNVEAGDPPPTEEMLSSIDYISVYIDTTDSWIHVNGPFEDWIDVEYDILYILDEY